MDAVLSSKYKLIGVAHYSDDASNYQHFQYCQNIYEVLSRLIPAWSLKIWASLHAALLKGSTKCPATVYEYVNHKSVVIGLISSWSLAITDASPYFFSGAQR
jgi:hypothetical protein